MSNWRPQPKSLIVTLLALLLVAIATGFVLRSFHNTTEVHIGSAVLQARLATTDAEREQGLSGVDNLGTNEGLLMVFPSDSSWGIWMKDMKIPLDIIWLNNEKKVIYIVNNASPDLGTSKTFYPIDPARYVIEVPAGTVKSAAIKIGSDALFTVGEGQ